MFPPHPRLPALHTLPSAHCSEATCPSTRSPPFHPRHLRGLSICPPPGLGCLSFSLLGSESPCFSLRLVSVALWPSVKGRLGSPWIKSTSGQLIWREKPTWYGIRTAVGTVFGWMAFVSFSAWIVRCVVLACCGFLSVHLLIYRLKIVFLGEDPYFSRVISHIFGEMQ